MSGPLAQFLFRMPSHTDTLRADHAVVRIALQALGAIGAHVRNGGDLPVTDSATLLRFLREFLLATHFRKENEWLWPAVVMRACERTAALVGELLRLQDEVTELVHSLVVFWEPVGDLTMAERSGFAETVTALGVRMQRMQEIEERKLFAACDSVVPADDQLDWGPAFKHLDAGRTTRDTWALQVTALAKQWVG